MRTATRSCRLFGLSSITVSEPSVRCQSRPMTERWATFDCYGTLIDWYGGIRGVIRALWPDADVERLLARHHAIEPLVQEGGALAYREVGARTLRAIAALEELPLAKSDAYAFADSRPDWPPLPEG